MVAIPSLPERSNRARHSALAALIRQATPRGSGSLRAGDLGNRQTVADYTRQNMWRYTHMYGAKHVAGWRFVRERLGWADEPSRPLVVLGSGSLLCATGWTWTDKGPRTVHAFDVLDWSPVLESRAGRALQRSLGRVHRTVGVFCPMTMRRVPAELRGLCGLRALRTDDVPRNSTVLMPMMLNHLLEGGALAPDTRAALATTFEVLKRRGCRILIADLASGSTTALWRDLGRITGAPDASTVVEFADIAGGLCSLYRFDHQDYRTFRSYPPGARLRMLVWDGRRWTGV